jgi:hypothetical protein
MLAGKLAADALSYFLRGRQDPHVCDGYRLEDERELTFREVILQHISKFANRTDVEITFK